MSLQSLASRSTAAVLGCAMLALSLSPASALTIPAPSIDKAAASAPIDKVYWRRHWGGGWGWGPGAVLGGLAAGALLGGGAYYAYGPRDYGYGPGYYEGPGYYGDYGPCWRRVGGPYGWHWARVC
jgi:hypothetical protein